MTVSPALPLDHDPRVNVVVFEVQVGHQVLELTGQAPAGSHDALECIWRALSERLSLESVAVRGVLCLWEPSPQDRDFLARCLGATVPVRFTFPRPDDEHWEQALREVEAALKQMRRRRAWWRFGR